MGISDFDKYDGENTLVDHETWDIILETALRDDPGLAETLGRLLLYVKEAIESGPEDITLAVNTLMEGIHTVYPYTLAFALSKKLWILSLEGHLTPTNESELVLEAALEKGWKETLKGRKRRSTRHKKREGPQDPT